MSAKNGRWSGMSYFVLKFYIFIFNRGSPIDVTTYSNGFSVFRHAKFCWFTVAVFIGKGYLK